MCALASIVKKKRKNGYSYYISYRITDPTGVRKQHWYPCKNKKEATFILNDIENAEKVNQLYVHETSITIPGKADNGITIEQMVNQYVEHCHRQGKWQPSTSRSIKSCIRNYIIPYIGNMPIERVTTRYLQEYYNMLPSQKAAPGNHRSPPQNITPRMIKEIHKILRPAFALAKKWEQVPSNPAIDLELPKISKYSRDQLSEGEIKQMISQCNDTELSLIIRMVYACTLRSGEVAGLTWDCVELSDSAIANGRAYIYVTKEIARLYREEITNTKADIIFTFPSFKAKSKTVLVLKRPKTDQSIRKVYLPTSLALELLDHKKQQDAHMQVLGKVYHNYNLVFAQPNGLPYAGKILSGRFKTLLKDSGLREVDYYSLRHSGATTKLRNSHNIKSVQADMGHSSAKMLMDVYAGIIDEDRVDNARIMEEILFSDSTDNTK